MLTKRRVVLAILVVSLMPSPVDAHGLRSAASQVMPPTLAPVRGGPDGLAFECPPAPVPQSQRDRTGGFTAYGCPYRIYDQSYHLGNVQLALEPNEQQDLVISTLHGAPYDQGPTNRSRAPPFTHSAFTTSDRGLNWLDQPTQYTDSGGGAVYVGESSDVVLDDDANVYLAYHWNRDDDDARDGYQSVIGLYKAATPHDPEPAKQSYTAPFYVRSRAPDTPIERVSLIHVPAAKPNVHELSDPEPSQAQGTGKTGERAYEPNATDARVALVYFERAAKDRPSPTRYTGWIDAHFTNTTLRNSWDRLPDEELIGPCRAASNAVAWRGHIYVACEVEKGYRHRRAALVGDIDLWMIDPVQKTTRLLGPTPLSDGASWLAVNRDGYMALLTYRPVSAMVISVQYSFGWYGLQWQPPQEGGGVLKALMENRPTHVAAVTGIAISDRDKVGMLVYYERQQRTNDTRSPLPVVPDPLNPQPPVSPLTGVAKALVTFSTCGFGRQAARLQLGVGIDPHNAEAYRQQPQVFDDLQDGLVASERLQTRETQFHFAVNDYGTIQFGAALPSPEDVACPIAPPFIIGSGGGTPVALVAGTTALAAVGSSLAVAALAMISYLLSVKRRVPQWLAAKDK